MNRTTRRYLIIGGSLLAVSAGGVGAAVAGGGGGGEDGEGQVTGPDADRARSAALQITNGGRANAVERDSENGATWEVEITKTDGKTVDIRLDENYKLVVVEGDSEAPDDSR